MRLSGVSLAQRMERSQNYVAKRLRDEMPFTLDDVEDIVDALELEISPEVFIAQAAERNGEEVWMQMDELEQLAKRNLTLAAHHNEGKGREREAREDTP
jgi:transcriptional regulator with XRE-family HTH domain